MTDMWRPPGSEEWVPRGFPYYGKPAAPPSDESDVRSEAREPRKINVTLGFLVDVEGDIDPKWVGQELCRLISAPQIGNPNFIATPTGVVFLTATETST